MLVREFAAQRAHGVVRRIDERHARELKLTQLAKFDPLTGELNRAFLTDFLAATLEETVRWYLDNDGWWDALRAKGFADAS